MNRDDVIRMAREAGDDWEHTLECDKDFLERFAALAFAAGAAHEREECAKVCELDDSMRWSGAAYAIRARGETK